MPDKNIIRLRVSVDFWNLVKKTKNTAKPGSRP
jgi:hypothetical protein